MINSHFNYPTPEEKIKLWEMSLADIDDGDFITVILHLCRTRERIWPDENLVAIVRQQIDKNKGDSAEEAWGKVLKQIASTGSWGTPKFDDHRLDAAVEILGWKTICGTTDKDMNMMRAHFFRTYQAIQVRSQVSETYRAIEASEVKRLISGIGKPITSLTSLNQETE